MRRQIGAVMSRRHAHCRAVQYATTTVTLVARARYPYRVRLITLSNMQVRLRQGFDVINVTDIYLYSLKAVYRYAREKTGSALSSLLGEFRSRRDRGGCLGRQLVASRRVWRTGASRGRRYVHAYVDTHTLYPAGRDPRASFRFTFGHSATCSAMVCGMRPHTTNGDASRDLSRPADR